MLMRHSCPVSSRMCSRSTSACAVVPCSNTLSVSPGYHAAALQVRPAAVMTDGTARSAHLRPAVSSRLWFTRAGVMTCVHLIVRCPRLWVRVHTVAVHTAAALLMPMCAGNSPTSLPAVCALCGLGYQGSLLAFVGMAAELATETEWPSPLQGPSCSCHVPRT